jgi:hypothetical protein
MKTNTILLGIGVKDCCVCNISPRGSKNPKKCFEKARKVRVKYWVRGKVQIKVPRLLFRICRQQNMSIHICGPLKIEK